MLQYVMHLLAVEDIEGLPPGGGISAKWVLRSVMSSKWPMHLSCCEDAILTDIWSEILSNAGIDDNDAMG